MLDLLLEFPGYIISVGDIPNPGQGLGPGKCTAERGQPRVNLSNDKNVFRGRYFREPLVYLLCRLCMMRWTVMSAFLAARDFAGPDKTKINGNISKILSVRIKGT